MPRYPKRSTAEANGVSPSDPFEDRDNRVGPRIDLHERRTAQGQPDIAPARRDISTPSNQARLDGGDHLPDAGSIRCTELSP